MSQTVEVQVARFVPIRNESRAGSFIHRAIAFTGIGFILALAMPVSGEEKPWLSVSAAYAPVLAYASSTPASLAHLRNSSSIHHPEIAPDFGNGSAGFAAPFTLKSGSQLAPSDERHFDKISRIGGQGGLFREGEMVLFRTRMPTRFSYRSWAGVQYGYGQLFATPDLIGRSRINGAGLDDPSCLYLKMSYNF